MQSVRARVLMLTGGRRASPQPWLGGADQSLLREIRQQGRFDPYLLTRVTPESLAGQAAHQDSSVEAVAEDPSQYVIVAADESYDRFLLTPGRTSTLLSKLQDFLGFVQPHVIHITSLADFGVEAILLLRRLLPDAGILVTLEDFAPLCHNHGLMALTGTGERCDVATPERCHGCFPGTAPAEFFRRERFIQAHLARADRVIVPSRFVRDRYVAWGLPATHIVVEDAGYALPAPLPDQPRSVRNRFAYVGPLTERSGILDLLKAVTGPFDPAWLDAATGDSPGALSRPELWVYPAHSEAADPAIEQRLRQAAAETTAVRVLPPPLAGDWPAVMADVDWLVAPSRDWGIALDQVTAALHFRRPVITTGLGGPAELVREGVNGLLVRAGDSHHLARVLRRAASVPGLWEKLQQGCQPARTAADLAATLTRMYADVLSARTHGDGQ